MTGPRGEGPGCLPGLAVPPWHLLLQLPASATVLDLGAGAARTAPALALAHARLLAVVPEVQQAEALRTHFQRAGLSRARAVVGAPPDVAVRRETVDLVVLGGALGSTGREASAGRAREAQLRLLRRAHDALRPGGWIVLGVDNRLAVRPAAWRDRSLCSVRGYRRLLEAAGYDDVRVWCAIPGHAEPRYLVPCRQRPFAHFVRRLDTAPRGLLRGMARATLHRLGLLKYAVDSYCITARSRGGGR